MTAQVLPRRLRVEAVKVRDEVRGVELKPPFLVVPAVRLEDGLEHPVTLVRVAPAQKERLVPILGEEEHRRAGHLVILSDVLVVVEGRPDAEGLQRLEAPSLALAHEQEPAPGLDRENVRALLLGGPVGLADLQDGVCAALDLVAGERQPLDDIGRRRGHASLMESFFEMGVGEVEGHEASWVLPAARTTRYGTSIERRLLVRLIARASRPSSWVTAFQTDGWRPL